MAVTIHLPHLSKRSQRRLAEAFIAVLAVAVLVVGLQALDSDDTTNTGASLPADRITPISPGIADTAAVPNISAAPGQTTDAFGCPGTLVISNTECELGVATAFDLDLSNRLAPWCEGRADTTVYGCNAIATQAQSRQGQCHREAPTLHPDGAVRAFEDPCLHDLWIDEVLVRLEAGRVLAQRCAARAHLTPACIP